MLCFSLAALLAGCGSETPAPPAADGSGAAASAPAIAALERVDLKAGAGPAIADGQTAVVNYTGWLYDAGSPDHKGRQFDSSIPGGQPFKFTLGAGQVIKGWDQGVSGMQVGGSRRLVIPASLAYGDAGAGGVIPPGAALVFDVDLLAIE